MLLVRLCHVLLLVANRIEVPIKGKFMEQHHEYENCKHKIIYFEIFSNKFFLGYKNILTDVLVIFKIFQNIQNFWLNWTRENTDRCFSKDSPNFSVTGKFTGITHWILTKSTIFLLIHRANEPRTVILHRGRKGFGFVLRGAKATSPLIEKPYERGPALQYLDDVDPGGVADEAGLKKGDYLLRVRENFFKKKEFLHVCKSFT